MLTGDCRFPTEQRFQAEFTNPQKEGTRSKNEIVGLGWVEKRKKEYIKKKHKLQGGKQRMSSNILIQGDLKVLSWHFPRPQSWSISSILSSQSLKVKFSYFMHILQPLYCICALVLTLSFKSYPLCNMFKVQQVFNNSRVDALFLS